MRGSIIIETMRTYIIILNICKFLYRLIEWLLGFKIMEVGTLVLQSIEITLHWGIVIRITGLAHALCYMNGFAKFNKCFRCKLRPLIAMEYQIPFYFRLRIQGYLQRPNGEITGNVSICNADYRASIMHINDCTVVANFMICKKRYVKSVHHFWLISSAVKSCLSLFSNPLCGLPYTYSGFLGHTIDRSPSSVFIYLGTVVEL